MEGLRREPIMEGETKTNAAQQGLHGEIRIPGDKSISHRSMMFSSLGSTPVHITNFLHAQDCLSTVACMRASARPISRNSRATELDGHRPRPARPQGAGDDPRRGQFRHDPAPDDGTLAPQPFLTTFTGDASLHKRPMGRVIKPLSAMGAKIYGREKNTKLPITIVLARGRSARDAI